MEEVNIRYLPEFEYYLENLIETLFLQEYFGFEDYAQNFVARIIDYIEANLSILPSKKTPTQLRQFGSNYVFYKANHRTTWYVFFEKSQNNFLITNIINSHSEEEKWL